MPAPVKISDAELDQILESLADEVSQTKVGAMHGVSQQAISKRLKDPAVRERLEAAIRAKHRRERSAQLRADRRLRRQQEVDASTRPGLAGPAVPVDPAEEARSREGAPRRGRLPGDPGTLIDGRGYYGHPVEPPRRRRHRGRGRALSRRRPYADWLTRHDLERLDPSFEMRLRDNRGAEIGHRIVGRSEALELRAQGWECIAP